MKYFFKKITSTALDGNITHLAILCFRCIVSLELIIVHGFKKIGIGVEVAESVPNPLHLPEAFNSLFADAANLLFPVLVILGFLTRLSVIPILAVTLTGYFVLHFHDDPLVRDTPFMYSLSYLLILFLGPGKYSIDNFFFKRLNS